MKEDGRTAVQKLFDLTGKTAVVTGASSGLGVSFAKDLADGRGGSIIDIASVAGLGGVRDLAPA